MSLTIGPIAPPAPRMEYDNETARLTLYNLNHALYSDVLMFFHHWTREFGRGEGTTIHKRAGSYDINDPTKRDGINGDNNLITFSTHDESDFVLNLIEHIVVPMLNDANPNVADFKEDANQIAQWLDQPWLPEPVPSDEIKQRIDALTLHLEALLNDPIGVVMLREQGKLLLKS